MCYVYITASVISVQYSRSWVRAPIGKKPKTIQLVFVSSPLSTQH